MSESWRAECGQIHNPSARLSCSANHLAHQQPETNPRFETSSCAHRRQL